MYRALARMVEAGLIEAAARRPAPDADDERRNYYRITDAGCAWRRAEARRLEALTRAARIGGLLGEGGEMTRDRLINVVRALVPAAAAALSAPTSATRWATRWSRPIATARARRWRRGGVFRLAARVGARARRLAAQRTRRAGAARGVVAAPRQLGPRRRDRDRAGCCARPRSSLAIVGTLTIGLGMFAVVYTVVQKILIEPMPYRDPDDLYLRLARLRADHRSEARLARPAPTSRSCRRPAA